MSGWYKSLLGHELELQFWYGQGGELEELVVWCHTCDSEGAAVMLVETRNAYVTSDAYEELMSKVDQHLWG